MSRWGKSKLDNEMLNPGSKEASDQFTLLLSTADITVKLKNRGPDAYKKDVYGDSISIEHRISSDGCRTCRLKSKSGDFPPIYRLCSCHSQSVPVSINLPYISNNPDTHTLQSPLCAVYILFSRSGIFLL